MNRSIILIILLIFIFLIGCTTEPTNPYGAHCRDYDGDGFYYGNGCGKHIDCDDSSPEINNNASEICDDLIDNNCDGLTDTEDEICSECNSNLDCEKNENCENNKCVIIDCTQFECCSNEDCRKHALNIDFYCIEYYCEGPGLYLGNDFINRTNLEDYIPLNPYHEETYRSFLINHTFYDTGELFIQSGIYYKNIDLSYEEYHTIIKEPFLEEDWDLGTEYYLDNSDTGGFYFLKIIEDYVIVLYYYYDGANNEVMLTISFYPKREGIVLCTKDENCTSDEYCSYGTCSNYCPNEGEIVQNHICTNNS